MILSNRSRQTRPEIRLTRANPGAGTVRPLPSTLHDPDWAIREIVDAVLTGPAREKAFVKSL